MSNAEGISGFVLEFLQSSRHTNAQECLFWHVAPRQQWEFWRRPAQLKMSSVPTFGTAVLRGKAHPMKMGNLDAGPEEMKPLCVMEMHWAVEVLKNKWSSFEWITGGAWFGRQQAEQTVLSTYWHFPRLLFQNPTIYGSGDCSLFLFSNVDGIPFPWICPVSPWCEFSAFTTSSWQVLHVVSLEKKNLSFELANC